MRAVEVRVAAQADIPALLDLQFVCYPVLSTIAVWREEHLQAHQRNFPEGQFVAVDGRKIVGLCSTFRVASRIALRPHSFREITGHGTFDTHDPRGNALYGAEIMVHPDYRRLGIASRFYQARFDLARRLRLRYFVAAGRLPGYRHHAEKLTVKQYVRAVANGTLSDRVLSAQIKNGLHVVDVIPTYLNDPKSHGYASLLMWENPDFSRRKLVRRRAGDTPPAARRTKTR